MTIIKLLKGCLLLSAIFLIGSAACNMNNSQGQNGLPVLSFSNELQQAIDQVMLEYAEYDLGISAAVSVPAYKTWKGASGFSQPGEPVTTDMLFDVGSIQKNFEAALAIKLVEDGELDLDDPVSKYLPNLANVDGEITLRQLLNHTSGIYNVFEHPDFPWVGAEVDYARQWRIEEVFSNFVLEPYGPPGYAQHYSSTNYLLVTAIIEEVSGSSVPEEMERYFLRPMKLEHTYISMGKPPPARYKVAHPWIDVDRDGVLDDLYGIPQTWKVSLTHPVIYTTAEDLVHWMQALYREGSVISPKSMEEMLTFPETELRDPGGGLYGLGVVNYEAVLGMPAIGHGGSALGYSAAALYLPEYGISVAWLINTGESPPELAGQMMGDTWLALSEALKRKLTTLERDD
jgi:D-alanyl-D-alanine carboxypeptidase